MFKGIDPKGLKEIESLFQSEDFAKREAIFSEGDPSDWLYIVEKGKVKITKLSQEGKEIILEIIPSSGMFGGIAVVKGFPYPANAVVMEDATLLKISRQNLMKVLDRFPEVMFSLIQNLGDRLKDSHETKKNIALEKVSSRIAALLSKLAEQTGTKTTTGGVSLELKLTKQDIAEMVGTTVETSIRTMSKFKKLGLIEEKAGKIIIKDLEGLKSV